MKVFAFDGTEWRKVIRAYMFYEGIGFVSLRTLKCFADGEWKVAEIETRELVEV